MGTGDDGHRDGHHDPEKKAGNRAVFRFAVCVVVAFFLTCNPVAAEGVSRATRYLLGRETLAESGAGFLPAGLVAHSAVLVGVAAWVYMKTCV